MQLISDFPWYFIFLCLLAGAAYSAILYFYGRNRDGIFSKPTRWGLAVLRFASVSVIAFLLLAPLVKRTLQQQEKPIVIVAQDYSQSILLCKDSAFYKGEYAQNLAKTIEQLKKDYDVQLYAYGSEVRNSKDGDTMYQDPSTDIASLLSEIQMRYDSRNLGALILTGDGIFNQGLNPVSLTEGLPYPIYTVAMGDTSVRRDALIANVRFNRIAYLNNQFPIEITLNANRLKGESKTLSVLHNGKTLFSKSVSYSSNDFSHTEQVLIDADQAGLQTYTIQIAASDGEASIRNNSRTINVEVIDGHQKVAIIAAAPHPDVAAIRQSLEENQNYEVSSMLIGDFKDKPSDYDLLILHNLPQKGSNLPPSLNPLPQGTPVIFVLGSQTDLARFNSLHAGLEIHSRINQFNESTPVSNGGFALFTLDDEKRSQIEHFPPLSAPFGDYKPSGNTQSLFTARVGTVQSGLPLIAFSQQQATRYAFICGEGIWRWRMADFGANQSHETFNTLLSKIAVYTSTRMDKDQFHVEAKNIYRMGESVTIEASLYNDNYELINTPEVEITLGNPDGKANSYLFNRTPNAYSLNAGVLDPGRYSYTAKTTFNGTALSASGSFVVEELNLEDISLAANHALLNTLAQNTGGALLMPQQVAQLPELLKAREDIKPIVFSQTRYTELLNLPWLFILIVLLLGAEWVLRKYNGEL